MDRRILASGPRRRALAPADPYSPHFFFLRGPVPVPREPQSLNRVHFS